MEEFRRSGGVATVRRMAKVEEQQSRASYLDPALIGANCAIIGEKDTAFAWLEKQLRKEVRSFSTSR